MSLLIELFYPRRDLDSLGLRKFKGQRIYSLDSRKRIGIRQMLKGPEPDYPVNTSISHLFEMKV